MFGRKIVIALSTLPLLVAVAGGPAVAVADEALLTDRLARALDSYGTDEAASRDESLAVWVRFVDKGLGTSELEAALVVAAAELSAEARARRAKADLGSALVNEADLPLNAGYLAEVAATGAVLRQQSRWLSAASFDATPAQLAAIVQLPCVERLDLVSRGRGTKPTFSAEPPAELQATLDALAADKTATTAAYGASIAGLEQINVPAVHAMGYTGAGVTIAVMDTGYELEHECFQHLDVVATWDFINDDEWVGTRKNDSYYQTQYGTASLSAIAGYSRNNLIAPAHGASVILAKTEDLSDETPAEEDNWIAALEWAEGLGADIVSSGLGYYYWYDFSDLDGQTALITTAAELAAARGVCVINQAGNERGNSEWRHIVPPADGRSVIAVGAVDLFGQISFLSSPGPTADGRIKPDVMALGVGTTVALFARGDMYFYGNGTNFATPLVTGVAALMLEHNPHLNPARIGEALRETASRAALPDNDFGWGVVDAVAAMHYWAPTIDHTPLTDIPAGTGLVTVTATITSNAGLDEARLWLAWRLEGESWHAAAMTNAGGDIYTGVIPPQSAGTVLEYYLSATDAEGNSSADPSRAPAVCHTFRVGDDIEAPVITHRPLLDMVVAEWPATVRVEATDNAGVDEVEVIILVNGSHQGTVPMIHTGGDSWELELPVPPLVVPGFSISYIVVAHDTAAATNIATSGPHDFRIIADKGRVLVVNDRWITKATSDQEARGANVVLDTEKNAGDIADMLTDAGYLVDVIESGDVQISSFLGYDAVLVTSGSNYAPLPHSDLRRTMVWWTEQGGRLIVEGGETGYAVAQHPGYPELMGTVLPIMGYAGENGANLRPPQEMADHQLLHQPHELTIPLLVDNMDGQDWGAADIVEMAAGEIMALKSAFGSTMGGVIIHDDNTGPEAAQIGYLPFDIMKVAPVDAQAFLDNLLTYLLREESPGAGAITGRVTLAGSNDHGNVTIRTGLQFETVSLADGSFSQDGLWGGEYRVTAACEGYAPQTRVVTVVDGAATSGVQFYLQPVTAASYPVAPGLVIPDNDPVGVSDTITVAENGTVLGVDIDIDISHYSIGNLTITLTDPAGTTVTLHNRTGGTADDLVGNWPASLIVDGPGTLADFFGGPAAGDWTMTVTDAQLGGTGTFNTWTLNLLVTASNVAAVGDNGPPAATRLVGNAPNPFNPRTNINFELAKAGPVRVDVYDLKGRLVRRLTDRNYAAGRHSVLWDGKDTAGADPASGIYFYRLQADGASQVRKMMLVR